MKNTVKNIIFYDSDCLLCLWSVRFVLRHDRPGNLYFSSFCSDDARSLAAAHKIDTIKSQSIIFLKNGRIYRKSDAIIQIAENFEFPFSCIKVLRWAPQKWRDAIYDFIADNRHRVFRKKKLCFIPQKSISQRFID